MSKDEKCTCKACKNTVFIVKDANLWGFCCRRRRGCLSSLINIPRRQTLATYRISPELAFGSRGGAARRRPLYVFKSSLTDSR